MPEVGKPIGVGAGKFCGVQRIFVQISPNLPEKTPMQMTSKKKKQKRLNFILFWAFFSNESTSNTIFAQISPNLPDKYEKNHDVQNKKTKTSAFSFRAPSL